MYTEWADYLADQKCGGKRERNRKTVEIGERYKVYFCGNYDETVTVTEENKAYIENDLNDPENDIREYEKV